MQQVSKVLPERFVACSKSIVLECRCGEKLVLLGREADWRKEGRTVFQCSGCGKKLSLGNLSKRVSRRIKVQQLGLIFTQLPSKKLSEKGLKQH